MCVCLFLFVGDGIVDDVVFPMGSVVSMVYLQFVFVVVVVVQVFVDVCSIGVVSHVVVVLASAVVSVSAVGVICDVVCGCCCRCCWPWLLLPLLMRMLL